MNSSVKHDRRRRAIIILFCFFAIFRSGLRPIENPNDEGNDTPTYEYSYNEISSKSWSTLYDQFSFYTSEYEGREGGYAFFVKATQLIYNDFRFFMFMTAAIFIIPLGRVIYKYVKTYEGLFLSILIYFALFDGLINGLMRQAVVMGLFIIALKYIKTQEWKKYFATIALLFTIHNSIVIAIPFYFMPKYCLSRKWILAAFIAGLFLMVFSAMIMSRVFVGTIYEGYGEGDSLGLINLLLLICLVSLLVYRCFDKLKSIADYEFLICGVLGTLVCLPFIRIGGSSIRICYYYFIFFIPLIPIVIDCICKEKPMRRLAYGISMCFFLFFILR